MPGNASIQIEQSCVLLSKLQMVENNSKPYGNSAANFSVLVEALFNKKGTTTLNRTKAVRS